jgi:type III secretory pathway component EscV
MRVTVKKNGAPVRHWSAQKAEGDAFLWVFGTFIVLGAGAIGIVVWAIVQLVNWVVTK